jgi:NADH/NAD ratio-sensing transcriptional regulator Rex
MFHRYGTFFIDSLPLKKNNVREKHMNESIPQPTLDRVCRIYNLLVEGSATGLRNISSQELGEKLGVPEQASVKT